MELSSAASWINTVFAGFDESISLAVHQLFFPMSGFFTPFFDFISLLGKYGIFLILLAIALMLNKPTRRVGTAMLVAAALGAVFTNLILKVIIARPRPFADESSIFHQIWMAAGQHMETDNSFPSGHVTAAVAAMTPVIVLSKPGKKLLALLFAVLMCIARIYLAVHYPSDVLGGIITGLIAGLLGVLIASKFPRNYYAKELRKKKS